MMIGRLLFQQNPRISKVIGDLKNDKLVDMYDAGIVDPFLVTKTALENAISAASLILTNGCSILKVN